MWRQRGDTEGKLSIPIGHGVSLALGDAGVGKSAPDIVTEGWGKLRGNPRRFSPSCTVKKSLVAIEAIASVPQTDTGR